VAGIFKVQQEGIPTSECLSAAYSERRILKKHGVLAGVLCAAGFGTPSEVLYLQKKLLVIPMKNQFEQVCNAAVLHHMGVTTIKSLKKKHLPTIHDWIKYGVPFTVNYPDETNAIVQKIIQENI
jgi:hypothetical protein